MGLHAAPKGATLCIKAMQSAALSIGMELATSQDAGTLDLFACPGDTPHGFRLWHAFGI